MRNIIMKWLQYTVHWEISYQLHINQPLCSKTTLPQPSKISTRIYHPTIKPLPLPFNYYKHYKILSIFWVIRRFLHRFTHHFFETFLLVPVYHQIVVLLNSTLKLILLLLLSFFSWIFIVSKKNLHFLYCHFPSIHAISQKLQNCI
jgi:hypothetical protein